MEVAVVGVYKYSRALREICVTQVISEKLAGFTKEGNCKSDYWLCTIMKRI